MFLGIAGCFVAGGIKNQTTELFAFQLIFSKNKLNRKNHNYTRLNENCRIYKGVSKLAKIWALIFSTVTSSGGRNGMGEEIQASS